MVQAGAAIPFSPAGRRPEGSDEGREAHGTPWLPAFGIPLIPLPLAYLREGEGVLRQRLISKAVLRRYQPAVSSASYLAFWAFSSSSLAFLASSASVVSA